MERRNLNDTRINIIVDPDFKQKVRMKAVTEKKSITKIVIYLLEKWLKK